MQISSKVTDKAFDLIEEANRKAVIRYEDKICLTVKLAVILILAVATMEYYDVLFIGGDGVVRSKRVIITAACFVAMGILSLIRIDISDRTRKVLNIALGIASLFYCVIMSDELINRAVTNGEMDPVPTFSKASVCLGVSFTTILLLFMLVMFLSNSTGIAAVTILTVTYLLSLAIVVVCDFRGTPLLASDFTSAKVAMNVAGQYSFVPTFFEYIALLGIVMLAFSFTQIRGWTIMRSAAFRSATAGITALLIVLFVRLCVLSDYLPMRGVQIQDWRPIDSYTTHGTITTFLRSIEYSLIKKPEGYSAKTVEEIIEKYMYSDAAKIGADSLDGKAAETPNMIIVVNEAFSNLEVLGDFSTNHDYMPIFNSLGENCKKGYYYASVIGGGTAMTEFELLTSCTSSFLPMGRQPFETYIRENIPALPSAMSALNYSGSIALHPEKAWNYNRIEAYPCLGFTDFMSIEDLPDDMGKVHGHVSDEATYKYIIDMYEKSDSSEAFFVYDLTMQNHSPYNKTYSADDPVKITDENKDEETENYLNLIMESDRALGMLIDYFKEDEKHTLIVFLGDHQPRISEEFLDNVTKGKSAEWTEEESLIRYKTPFLIWTNYDIDEEYVDEISANYLQSMIFDAAGLKKTGFQKYLTQLRKDVPWINSLGYVGSNGKFYKSDDVTSPYYELINEYRIIQYNYLFGGKNRIREFFELK